MGIHLNYDINNNDGIPAWQKWTFRILEVILRQEEEDSTL